MQGPPAPDFYVDSQNPHLGGYIRGGDDATYYPDLWRWFVDECDVRSVVDVGCGEGHAVRFFEALDCHVIGVDGVAQDHPLIVRHDYSSGPWPKAVSGNRMEAATDLVWSCEFVEHVHEQYVPNFLETFLMGRMVALTHAEPGQAGHHHVNCQPESYWRGAMAAVGFQIAEDLTLRARAMAALNPNPFNHFARSGLVFVRIVSREEQAASRFLARVTA